MMLNSTQICGAVVACTDEWL